MSRCTKPLSADQFIQKLQTLRLKIDQLPAEHRPHLYELADLIAQQHNRLHQKKVRTHESK